MAIPTKRDCRYQAAIVQDGNVLLLKVKDPHSQRSFWLIPGGGREGSECEEDCVVREVREETHLEVEVVRLLWEETVTGDATYRRTKTYLCRPVGGSERAGSEPELDEHEHHIIEDLAWFPLSRPDLWGSDVEGDVITSANLARLREELAV